MREAPPITCATLGGGVEVARPETRCDQYPTWGAWQWAQASSDRRPKAAVQFPRHRQDRRQQGYPASTVPGDRQFDLTAGFGREWVGSDQHQSVLQSPPGKSCSLSIKISRIFILCPPSMYLRNIAN